eukprot:876091-Amorphochlora_amoeboformis.AAC.3
MTIQAQDSCESVSFKRKWAGGLHSTGSASSRGILRVRGGQSEQGGPQGLGDPSTRNVSRFYLDVEKWSVERIAFKNPDIISQLKRRLSILKQMETAVGLQIALPDRSHIVLNGTQLDVRLLTTHNSDDLHNRYEGAEVLSQFSHPCVPVHSSGGWGGLRARYS